MKEVKDMTYYYQELVTLLYSAEFRQKRDELSKKDIQNVLNVSSILPSKSSNFCFQLLDAECNIEFGSLTERIRLALSALSRHQIKAVQSVAGRLIRVFGV